ncbi:MAG TPA: hypothetical protein DCP28_08815 [Cytophagales bacterium]|nr:hypothetical protein [Cytophagales bacterium]
MVQGNPAAKQAGNQFYATWYSRAFNGRKDSIRNLTQHFVDLGYNRTPHLSELVGVLVAGANHRILDGPQYDSLLYMIDQTATYYKGDVLLHVLKTARLYLERDMLFNTNFNRLRAYDGEVSFSFVPPPTIGYVDDYDYNEDSYEDDYYDEQDDTTDEENPWGSWEESEEESTEWSDDWDTWDTGSTTEEAVEEDQETFEDFSAYEEVALPKEGPIMHLENVNLVMGTRWDSVVIQNTTGDLLLTTDMWDGNGGRFDWSSTGLLGEQVYADFGIYNFDITRPEVSAENVTFMYDGYIKHPTKGIFDFQSRRHKTPSAARYPRFMAYDAQVEIIALGDPILTYEGGFGMQGPNVNSSSLNEGFSILTARDSTGALMFRAKAKRFVFEKDGYELTTPRATVSIYQGNDSIYHPMVKFRYTVPIRHLTLQSPDNDFKNHPYHASFYGMDFYTDVVYWDLNTDTVDITILNATNQVPAVFQSKDYFNESDFDYFGITYGFHPMLVYTSYARKVRSNTFYLEDLAKQTGLSLPRLVGAAKILHARGFVKYDSYTSEITLLDKTWHYVRAKFRKKDYDDMFIPSLSPNERNATINRETNELTIRGIPRFNISEELDTYIEPENESITLVGDRDFKFDGQLQVGNFQFIGEDFTFKYDAFLVELTKIDSIRFFIEVIDENGNVQRKLIDNQLVGVNSDSALAESNININVGATAGTIYINRPNNKSGAKDYSDYPVFDANQGAIVYFDDPSVLGGVYDQSLYYVIPPFKIDSLADSDPGAISFPGTFYSNGILPPIKENLVVTEDNILGFQHSVPEEGLPLYDGKGRVYNEVIMDRNGLQANGKIDYLSTSLESEQFTFYNDSVYTETGVSAVIKPGPLGTASFPDAQVFNYTMSWFPHQEEMRIQNNGNPIDFYNATATLDGLVKVKPDGAYGNGTLLTRGSETRSDSYSFTEQAFVGRNAYFEIKSDNERKPAVLGQDVRLDFQLDQNFAEISPEQEGVAAIGFPYAQYKTSIPSAIWSLDENTITMNKPDEVPIENSYFYSTRSNQDSLVFNATTAEYIIDSLKMRVGGIPYIVVADAFIIPDNNQVVIQQGAQIEKLKNAELFIDTLNEYHNLVEGNIDIVSRNKFFGDAYYRLVNSAADTFNIDLDRFQLVEDENARRGEKQFNTVSSGTVKEEDNVVISPGMIYRGRATMYANQPALELQGLIKLDFRTVPNYDEWIRYSSSAESQKVIFDFNTSVTEGGRQLEGGLHFDRRTGEVYHTFVTRKRNAGDPDFFLPSGNLYYDEDNYDFVIADPMKDTADAWSGRVFRFEETKQEIAFEGPITLMEDEPGANIVASAKGNYSIDSSLVKMNTFMTVDFDVPVLIQSMIAEDVLEVVEILGAMEASRDPVAMTYLLAEIVGEEDAMFFDEASLQEYTPVVEASRELRKTLVLSDVDMQWSSVNQSWFNTGSRIGLSNVQEVDVNAGLEGYMEIRRTQSGQELNLFMKAAPESWYYFQYSGNRVGIYTSNQEINDEINARSNALKAKPEDFVFYGSDIAETMAFINRFRQTYYGIMDMYQLDDPAIGLDMPVTADDFGTPGEPDDDDDDGF